MHLDQLYTNLGQLLKQARLEAGLSQRQLCGDQITRNMLSQIENGSAQPSMDTLRYLAGRLGKPISFFLGETTLSPGSAALADARKAWTHQDHATALALLAPIKPDDSLASEAFFIKALCYLAQARIAQERQQLPYARTLLEKAAEAGGHTPLYTPELERTRLLLMSKIDPESCAELLHSLADDELLLRASVAMRDQELERCAALLDSCSDKTSPDWYLLRGDVYFAQENFAMAREHYQKDEARRLYRLEQCCKELGDYEMAYRYACKQR